MIARLLLFFLLIPSPLWAAIAYVDEVCHASNTTPGNTLACVAINVMEVGNPTFFYFGFDNTGTTDADHVEVKSMSDPVGNIYSKVCEFTNGQGSAAAGITGSLWMTLPTVQLNIGQAVQAVLSSSVTARAISSAEFTVGGGMTLAIQGACQTLANDAADAGSMQIKDLTNASTLFLRVIAGESRSISLAVPTADYAALVPGEADTGTDSGSASVIGEYRIVTDTNSTSDPTMTDTNDDYASLFAAFREVSAAVSTRRRQGAVDIN